MVNITEKSNLVDFRVNHKISKNNNQLLTDRLNKLSSDKLLV